jgi:hypothetical protein
MGIHAVAAAVVAVTVAVLLVLALGDGEERMANAAEAQRVALDWTGAARTEAPRRHGEDWEVDAWRADGSLVEVTVGPSLQVREFDEELGPGGNRAHDELRGANRVRAIEAARGEPGVAGVVGSVEREDDGTYEVNFVRPDRTVLEVELDQRLRVTDVDEEEIGDE